MKRQLRMNASLKGGVIAGSKRLHPRKRNKIQLGDILVIDQLTSFYSNASKKWHHARPEDMLVVIDVEYDGPRSRDGRGGFITLLHPSIGAIDLRAFELSIIRYK
jgi:hypothetical protein